MTIDVIISRTNELDSYLTKLKYVHKIFGTEIVVTSLIRTPKEIFGTEIVVTSLIRTPKEIFGTEIVEPR